MAAIEMSVEQVTVDPVLGTPVLVLGEIGGQRRLPIAIGQVEAVAIVSEIENIPMMRPMTHDLVRNLMGKLDAEVQRVTVTALRDGIYFAEMTMRSRGEVMQLDCRPSDGVALALRWGARIFVDEGVVIATASEEAACRAAACEPGPRPIVCDGAACGEVLEDLGDEDFGKWKM